MRSLEVVYRLRRSLSNALQQFFEERQFIEITTPTLVPTPGTEVHLDYFTSEWQDAKLNRHAICLRSSPELHMKQALTSGLTKVYQIGPCFRNHGELGVWHHPEFTMLEWYDTETTYKDFIKQTLDLLRYTHDFMKQSYPDDIKLALPQTIKEFSIAELVKNTCNIDFIDQDPELASKGLAAGVRSITGDEDFETAYFKILIERVEPFLNQFPVCVVKDYPASQAALARIEHGVAQRFEVFINGIELSNAFHELVDEEEHINRFHQTTQLRQGLGKFNPPVDVDFLEALKKGLPDCCGNALGFDRWLALLLGDKGISGVIPFRLQAPYRNGQHGSL